MYESWGYLEQQRPIFRSRLRGGKLEIAPYIFVCCGIYNDLTEATLKLMSSEIGPN